MRCKRRDLDVLCDAVPGVPGLTLLLHHRLTLLLRDQLEVLTTQTPAQHHGALRLAVEAGAGYPVSRETSWRLRIKE